MSICLYPQQRTGPRHADLRSKTGGYLTHTGSGC
jgi:hypothetical protein